MSYKTERMEEFKVLTRSQLAAKYKGLKFKSEKIGPLPKDWKPISINERPERDTSKKLDQDACGHCGEWAGPNAYLCQNCIKAMNCGQTLDGGISCILPTEADINYHEKYGERKLPKSGY